MCVMFDVALNQSIGMFWLFKVCQFVFTVGKSAPKSTQSVAVKPLSVDCQCLCSKQEVSACLL